MTSGHHVHVALVLLGGLLLDAVDDTPDIAGQRCFDDLCLHFHLLLNDRRLLDDRRRCLHDWRRRGGDGCLHPLNRRGWRGCGGHGRRHGNGRSSIAPRALRLDRYLAVGRRVGLAEVRTAHLDRMLRRGNVFQRFLVVIEQGTEVESHTVGSQSRQTAMPSTQTVGLRVVERHREVRRVAQNLPDQPGQDAARTNLDETGDPVAGHRLDHLAEPHHLLNLIAELHGDVLAVHLRGGVGVDREVRLPDLQRLEVCRQGCATGRHDLRVERRGNRKAHGRPAFRLRLGLGPGDIGLISGEHHLGGRVVIGDDQRSRLRLGGQQGAHVIGSGRHGQHRAVLALARFVHQRASHASRLDQTLGRQHAGGCQRSHLTEAVARGGGRAHPEEVEQRELRETRCGNGRLRVGHRGEFFLLRIHRGGVESRLGEHH